MCISLVIASYVFGETSLSWEVLWKKARRGKRNVMAVSSFETSSHGHVIKARRVRAARREKLLGILSPLLTDLGFESLRVGFLLVLRSSTRRRRVARYHRRFLYSLRTRWSRRLDNNNNVDNELMGLNYVPTHIGLPRLETTTLLRLS